MAYPVRFSGKFSPPQLLIVPFRPVKAGLVKVIAIVTWDSSVPLPTNPGDDAPPAYFLGFKLDILKPGSATPVASTLGRKQVGSDPKKDLGIPRLILWLDTLATTGDLAADWTASLTNNGDVAAAVNVTIRYQVVDGNLGKIDHIVVMMLENRSFDHMLGYLSLEGGRTDIDGLTGKETNLDDSTDSIPVHHLASSMFRSDPGHGYDQVAEQLNFFQPNTTPLKNAGFVHNFTEVLADDAKGLPPLLATVADSGLLAGGDSRSFPFRPSQPGPITIVTSIDKSISHSETGKLGSINLYRPSNPTAVFATAPVTATSIALNYTATAADLIVPGNWTCSIANGTETSATFTTHVRFVQQLHDTSLQEPPSAIMGYYNGVDLPAYDVLAREFTVCDRWFACLPTDTFPNRFYGLTGGSGTLNTTPSAAQILMTTDPVNLKTVFEVLQPRGIDWKVFFADLPFAFLFKAFAQDAAYSSRLCSLNNGSGADLQHAIDSGDMPSVCWIDPNFSDFREKIGRAHV